MATLKGFYKLERFNGEAVPAKERIHMNVRPAEEMGESQYRIRFKVANTIQGTVARDHDELKGMLMSTRMGGTPYQMSIEHAITAEMAKGMKVTVSNDLLTLSRGTVEMVFSKLPILR